MRYLCNIEGFDGCFVEFSERWTRIQVKTYFSAKNEEYFDLLRSKIISLHLVVEGGAIDNPDELTLAATDDMDMMLWRWFATAAAKCIDDLNSLGEAHARRWLDVQENLTTALQDKARLN